MEYLAERLAAVPGVVAVTLGGSRAVGTAVEGSDWDFGLYYRGGLDPADISALGWPGRVFAPGEWGSIVNGGAWLRVGGAKVDLIYRDLDEVLRWTAAAGEGPFEIRREVGYVAGIATYILAGELALGQVLAGELPRPAFPPRLRETAPTRTARLPPMLRCSPDRTPSWPGRPSRNGSPPSQTAVRYGADYSRVSERVTAHPSRAARTGHTNKITHPVPMGAPPTRAVNTRQMKPARIP